MSKLWTIFARITEFVILTITGFALFPVGIIIYGTRGFAPKVFVKNLYSLFKEKPEKEEEP